MIGLFVGRFEPFHKGHLNDVVEALKEVNTLIIAIGSSQYSSTSENPFSFEERKQMIETTLRANKLKNYRIIAVPDINDDKKWVQHTKSIVGDFDVVYTGNDFTEKLFKEKGYKIKRVEIIDNINGTTIRNMIINNQPWKHLVPEQIIDFIEKLKGRIKKNN